jgi:hypothetical protein
VSKAGELWAFYLREFLYFFAFCFACDGCGRPGVSDAGPTVAITFQNSQYNIHLDSEPFSAAILGCCRQVDGFIFPVVNYRTTPVLLVSDCPVDASKVTCHIESKSIGEGLWPL